jgi:ABC-2 type transport system permease protein
MRIPLDTPARFGVRRLAAAYGAYFRQAFAIQMQYRASLVIWLLGTVLRPVIYLVVWSAVARSTGGSTGGYTPQDFAAYYIILMVVDQLTFTWVMWEYDYRIRMGELSAMLLRPIHPVHGDIADNLTYKLLSLVLMGPVVALLVWFFTPAFRFEWWSVALFVPALGLAFIGRFLLGWALAMIAFWTTRITAINSSFFALELFFAGQIAPLALLPAALRGVATVLPFRWLLAFPVELLQGVLTPREALIGLGMQLFWVVAIAVLMQTVWRAGVRRYAAFGG